VQQRDAGKFLVWYVEEQRQQRERRCIWQAQRGTSEQQEEIALEEEAQVAEGGREDPEVKDWRYEEIALQLQAHERI
jgi:hypothetical protein